MLWVSKSKLPSFTLLHKLRPAQNVFLFVQFFFKLYPVREKMNNNIAFIHKHARDIIILISQ